MSRASPWLRLMAVAFVANGLGPFGLKIMAEKGLSETYHYQYLILWYAGGLVFGIIWFLATRDRFRAQELVMSFGIGMASFGGQFFSLLALEKNVPGYVVFPMTTGGNLFLVAAAGVFLFRERVGPYGIAGILTGILSLILLSLG
jgi:multidrug transporter EmrE-like cation transporter